MYQSEVEETLETITSYVSKWKDLYDRASCFTLNLISFEDEEDQDHQHNKNDKINDSEGYCSSTKATNGRDSKDIFVDKDNILLNTVQEKYNDRRYNRDREKNSFSPPPTTQSTPPKLNATYNETQITPSKVMIGTTSDVEQKMYLINAPGGERKDVISRSEVYNTVKTSKKKSMSSPRTVDFEFGVPVDMHTSDDDEEETVSDLSLKPTRGRINRSNSMKQLKKKKKRKLRNCFVLSLSFLFLSFSALLILFLYPNLLGEQNGDIVDSSSTGNFDATNNGENLQNMPETDDAWYKYEVLYLDDNDGGGDTTPTMTPSISSTSSKQYVVTNSPTSSTTTNDQHEVNHQTMIESFTGAMNNDYDMDDSGDSKDENDDGDDEGEGENENDDADNGETGEKDKDEDNNGTGGGDEDEDNDETGSEDEDVDNNGTGGEDEDEDNDGTGGEDEDEDNDGTGGEDEDEDNDGTGGEDEDEDEDEESDEITGILSIEAQTESRKPFSFYVMGDIPYDRKEEEILASQLKKLSRSEGEFMVHVGDIQFSKRTFCSVSTYTDVQRLFVDNSDVPVFILPGDNDWSDCPDPDSAARTWMEHFHAFTDRPDYWGGTHNMNIDWMEGDESNFGNFAMWNEESKGLFIGLNMISALDNEIDETEWNKRLDHNLHWTQMNIDRHHHLTYLAGAKPESNIKYIVLFGHAKSKNSYFFKILNKLYTKNDEYAWLQDVPMIYFHGDGHTWEVSERWSLPTVQVDQGAKAPPLKVTVRGKPEISENAVTIGGIFECNRNG